MLCRDPYIVCYLYTLRKRQLHFITYLFELIIELTQTKLLYNALPLILEDILHVYALKLVEILMFV